MFKRVTYLPYTCDIAITKNQQKYLVNQVIKHLDAFYQSNDNRRLVLNAFTGSGKTTVTLKVTIPEFIKKFYPQGKRVIAFMAPRGEVVDQTYQSALKVLHNKICHGARVKCYNSDDINKLKRQNEYATNYDVESNLDGDVIVLFFTAQYFYTNFDFLAKENAFDLTIIDEAHLFFGTISAEDTRADKGVTNNNFEAKTLDKLACINNAAVLFLSATPTNSQREFTALGKTHNVYLTPMPRDVLTTPFFDVISYSDSEDTVIIGLNYFKQECDKIANVINQIDDETWKNAPQFTPGYPAALVRLARRNARNGASFDENIDEVIDLCKQYNFRVFVSTSKERWLGVKYNTINSLAEGVQILNRKHSEPVVIVVIESGTAGLDLPKINNVIIGRNPKGVIHNNYSQTAGRAARMKQGFINHADAVEAIKTLNVSDTQKRLLCEYYILHSTSVVHVPVESKLLNNDVKEFIETETYREYDGRKYILEGVFGVKNPMFRNGFYLSNDNNIENDFYKRFKKTYCECCVVTTEGKTKCYWAAKEGFENLLNVNITTEEMDFLWPLCLHVHHLDGNHFNNNPSNLITICPNVHSTITIYNEDYNNRYPELHEALTKLRMKKENLKTEVVAI
jgi:superfamily II DNA or RNA helicase